MNDYYFLAEEADFPIEIDAELKNKEDLCYIFEHNDQISYWSKRKNIDIR